MFYNSYGYGTYPMIPGFMPNSNFPNNNNDPLNEINNRLNKLERTTRKLEQRISRLETPYNTGNTTNIYNEQPDNSMYML